MYFSANVLLSIVYMVMLSTLSKIECCLSLCYQKIEYHKVGYKIANPLKHISGEKYQVGHVIIYILSVDGNAVSDLS